MDFGLALKEEDFGKGSQYAGTPSYMSPEQARGEGHRVDGRSDIFSLAVVFYELLTSRRPFRGDTPLDVQIAIIEVEPRPPRMWDDTIPKELDRICLKALAKRATDRYSTAKDLADDLRHAAAVAPAPDQAAAPVVPSSTSPVATTPDAIATDTLHTPSSDGQAIKIVPKGLRSFDAHDADFFLELVPGPRDRDGLPDSIRFWKTRIQETDADSTFQVGLIYGPSGCGKSSLVKAGLLPRLAKHVGTVYVEATAAETEVRLLKGLRKQCPELPAGLTLAEAVAALRRGRSLLPGEKVLIVLDQFEQWLHAQRDPENAELVHALRQCDGGRVQCVLLVRDDFWMAATRFMRALEVRLVEGQNSAAADLFDLRHARKVLAAFGRAFGTLPEDHRERTADQQGFLDQAVAGLAQDGKVVCVRLALLAEMMKSRPWTPESLKAVGGAEGVGVAFLEETFSSSIAPPEHRLHQKATRAVLAALLPEPGSDIKGHMRCSYWLHDVRPRALDPETLAERLAATDDAREQFGLLQALGEYDVGVPPLGGLAEQPAKAGTPTWRGRVLDIATRLYRDSPRRDLHAASRWLLVRWGEQSTVAAIDAGRTPSRGPADGHEWFTNGQGMTMVVIPAGEFWMGSPPSEPERESYEVLHAVTISRPFAMADREVTLEPFHKFHQEAFGAPYNVNIEQYSPRRDNGPVMAETWFEALAFCRWLSDREGIDPEQNCLPPLEKLVAVARQADAGQPVTVELPRDFLARPGYRLPTEAEWEYACRAGVATRYNFGNDRALLDRYGWFTESSGQRTRPTGLLRPNDWGLFDMHGNMWEWCMDWYGGYSGGRVTDPVGPARGQSRLLRGGGWVINSRGCRSAYRYSNQPTDRDTLNGFRVVVVLGGGGQDSSRKP